MNAGATSVTGTYLVDYPALETTEDTSGNRYACTYTLYDGAAYNTGQQSSLTLGEVTRSDRYTDCGNSGNGYSPGGQQISTTAAYDSFGNAVASDTPDAVAGIAGHTGCTVGSAQYASCTAYDTTFDALPASHSNALNQTTTLGYSQSAGGGFGLWPTSTTDPNHQTTSTSYDALGRPTSTTLPGETSGETTTARSYTVWCSGTGAQAPCAEVDSTQRLDSSTTTVSRAFYDGWGHLLETRTAAPGGQDVVRYAIYDPKGHRVFLSIPYFTGAYTGGPGAAAFATPDASQPGTSDAYDGLDRVTSTTDALSDQSTTSYSVACGSVSGDSACYEQVLSVDPNGHQQGTLTDSLGRQTYAQRYTGNSGSNYAVYSTTKNTYDYNGSLTQILHPDGTSKTTYSYDLAGRQTAMSDPDRGSESYAYDPDGNLVKSVDARGSTVYAGYDGLDRQLWRNTSNSPSGAYVSYTYDSTSGGNQGVGRLTGESFSGGPNNSLTGSYSYTYDGRGQVTGQGLTVNGSSYPTSSSYNDAGQVTSQTYPDGEVVTTGYTGQGWLLGVSTTPQGGSPTTLLGNVTYSGPGGALGEPTGGSLGGMYTLSDSYDLLGRLSDARTSGGGGTTFFEEQPGYDAAGNVVSVATTLPQGTDNQQFCYDEQNRLTWAGSTGTPPCGGTLSAGTLVTAQYTASYSYDTLDRLTSSPQGSYSYGDSAHLHAATAIGLTWTAAYDPSGDMTCRSALVATSCTTSPQTGNQLSYDAEGRLSHWQDLPAAPTHTDDFLYDGEGHRVAQQVSVVGGQVPVTTTVYVGDLEEIVTAAGQPTITTTYYYAGAERIALAVNGTISYLANDHLKSADVTLSSSTQLATASRLYGPYGTVRYSVGVTPGSYGFTGQHDDTALTGLDYYGARYYDPTAGQFTSADPAGGSPLNRYLYVGGNPETFTDPTGQLLMGGTSGGGAPPPPPPSTNTTTSTSNAGGLGGALGGFFGELGSTLGQGLGALGDAWDHAPSWVHDVGNFFFGIDAMRADWRVMWNDKRSLGDRLWAGADFTFQAVSDALLVVGIGEGLKAGTLGFKAALEAGDTGLGRSLARGAVRFVADAAKAFLLGCGGGESFRADTAVATPAGLKAIGRLKVGERVRAYDPTTGKTTTQTVEHVFLDHDTDLLDVTLRPSGDAVPAAATKATAAEHSTIAAATRRASRSRTARGLSGLLRGVRPVVVAGVLAVGALLLPAVMPSGAAQALASPVGHASQAVHKVHRAVFAPNPAGETIHTTAKHPWLTADRGWVRAGDLRVGEPVRRADGGTAIVAAVRVVPGAGETWDLTVSQVHTFAVGAGAYVVHNCGGGDPAETLSALRRDLNVGWRRTVAYADYSIGGDVGRVVAVSGKAARDGAIDMPATRLFKTLPEANNSREYEAEGKILEYLGNAYRDNPEVSGWINLYVDRPPCASCQSVIGQFQAVFRNINLTVIPVSLP